jgi:sugar phosphate isomerase/epimerase
LIENHDRFRATELASIIESISHEKVGVCLDCVNSLGAGEGLQWVSDVLAPFTVNLHIKDFSIRRVSHQMGFVVTGAPAGSGMTHVPELLNKLSRYKRCTSAVLEQWVGPESKIDDTIKKEQEWAKAGIRYLRQLPEFRQGPDNK